MQWLDADEAVVPALPHVLQRAFKLLMLVHHSVQWHTVNVPSMCHFRVLENRVDFHTVTCRLKGQLGVSLDLIDRGVRVVHDHQLLAVLERTIEVAQALVVRVLDKPPVEPVVLKRVREVVVGANHNCFRIVAGDVQRLPGARDTLHDDNCFHHSSFELSCSSSVLTDIVVQN